MERGLAPKPCCGAARARDKRHLAQQVHAAVGGQLGGPQRVVFVVIVVVAAAVRVEPVARGPPLLVVVPRVRVSASDVVPQGNGATCDRGPVLVMDPPAGARAVRRGPPLWAALDARGPGRVLRGATGATRAVRAAVKAAVKGRAAVEVARGDGEVDDGAGLVVVKAHPGDPHAIAGPEAGAVRRRSGAAARPSRGDPLGHRVYSCAAGVTAGGGGGRARVEAEFKAAGRVVLVRQDPVRV